MYAKIASDKFVRRCENSDKYHTSKKIFQFFYKNFLSEFSHLEKKFFFSKFFVTVFVHTLGDFFPRSYTNYYGIFLHKNESFYAQISYANKSVSQHAMQIK